jgi:hypothetical protein
MNPSTLFDVLVLSALCLSSSLSLSALDNVSSDQKGSASAYRVLFVGNSLIYFSSVHRLVRDFGERCDPSLKFEVSGVLASGENLAGHLTKSNVLQRIEKGTWTHVVLQPVGNIERESLALKSYRSAIERIGARMVLYMTPHYVLEGPDSKMSQRVSSTHASFKRMAQENNAWIAPTLDACLDAKTADPLLVLRNPERGIGNPHQGPQGAFLIAATIFTTITGRSPLESTLDKVAADKYVEKDLVLQPELARWMKAVALRAVLKFHQSVGIGREWNAPTLPLDLPDTSVTAIRNKSVAERKAEDLALRWELYANKRASFKGKAHPREFGVLQAIMDDFPGTPDAAKASALLKRMTDGGILPPTDSDNRPGR